MGKPREEVRRERPKGLSKYAQKVARRRLEGVAPPPEQPPAPPSVLPTPRPSSTLKKSPTPQQISMRVRKVSEKFILLNSADGKSALLPGWTAQRDVPGWEFREGDEVECTIVPDKRRPEDFFVKHVLRVQ